VAYSCDTEPCEEITALGTEADILIHEANGDKRGHTSIAAAADVAVAARVKELILVHLPPDPSNEELVAANEIFSPIRFGEELECISF